MQVEADLLWGVARERGVPSSRQAPGRQVAAAPAGEQRPASKQAAGKQRQKGSLLQCWQRATCKPSIKQQSHWFLALTTECASDFATYDTRNKNA